MCRVTMGHLRLTIGHLRVTIVYLRVTLGSVAKRENVPFTSDAPKNCHPFYRNQILFYESIIAS